ncbi:hypothetical protein SALBM217S_01356 [Streptomyces griseoloalbus]
MPSTIRPSPWSGCGRRTDSKRRTSASSEDSRKTVRRVTPRASRSARDSRKLSKRRRPRTSTTTAIRATLPWGARAELHHGGDQRGRQVVDDEPAEVLQALRGRRPPRPGHPGDDHQFGDAGLGHPAVVLARFTCAPLSCRTPARAVAPPACCAARSPGPVSCSVIAPAPVCRPGRPWTWAPPGTRLLPGFFRVIHDLARRRVHGGTAGHRLGESRDDHLGRLAAYPGTSQIWSIVAGRSCFNEPKCLIRACLLVSPRPGTSSRGLERMRWRVWRAGR